MKEKITQQWIPIYVDKWIFGSTRIELEPGERSVFTDLLCLGAKDNGHIRANNEVGYLPRQLAGLLNITEELLLSTIEKCIKYNKIEDLGNGIYKLKNWDEFQFSRWYKWKIVKETKETEKEEIKNTEIKNKDFESFWENYPRKVGKCDCEKAWKNHNPPIEEVLKTISLYKKTDQWKKDNGQFIPLPATFIRQERWKDEVNILPNFIDKTLFNQFTDLKKELEGTEINEKTFNEILAILWEEKKAGRNPNARLERKIIDFKRKLSENMNKNIKDIFTKEIKNLTDF